VAVNARIVWVDGAQFSAESGSGHIVAMDGAPESGGRNLATRPMEMMLIGMGGCTAIDVIDMLRKQRQDVTDFRIELSAERATDHPKVFTEVKVTYRVRGRRLNRSLIERAVSLSESKYCSATAMIAKSARISSEVMLEDEPT
jgi:putative redox protein